MNRTTAILVALATLLVHVLAIHQNVDGDFGPPFEFAHVAYRAARNLVYEGTLAWTTGGTVIESYPSPLWVGISAIFTQAYLPPTVATQYLGIACALLTVIVLAQFSTDRLAGLIGLLLLVVTGTTAAAAASGTEYSLVMLLVTGAFLAFERRARRATTLLLSVLIVTRNDLWILVGALFLIELFDARRNRAKGRPILLRAFLVPLLLVGVSVLVRMLLTGTAISPTTRLLMTVDSARYHLGFEYVFSFFLRSGAATLVVFPIWYLLRGALSETGQRALAMVGVWSFFIAAVGGDGFPFWMGMAPVLPLLYLTVQEAMIIAMDSRRFGVASITWALFVLCVLASGFASRVPTDIGGLPFRRIQLAWMQPSDSLWHAYARPHGRRGLMQEIEAVEELRALSVFLRDRLEVGTTILTPWPGAIGYMSRQEVIDLLGRASPPIDGSHQRSWYGMPRLDIPTAMDAKADYIVPVASSGTSPPRVGEVVRLWIERNQAGGQAGDSIVRALSALRDYELVSVPVPRRSYRPNDMSPHPFYMLRSKGLKLQPKVEIASEEGELAVLAWHDGHQQIVDLEVLWTGDDGRVLHLRPTGDFVADQLVHARAGLLLHPTGQLPIRLMSFRLPTAFGAGSIEAVLQNPNSEADPQFSMVSRPATLRIDG